MNIDVIFANYDDPRHAKDLSYLLNSYAMDPMGGGKALPQYVQENLARELSRMPQAFSVLCYVDDKPAGLVNCFEAFSSFKCKPLINIHDVAVIKEFRGLGICQRMLQLIDQRASEKGCCKITLEVLDGNEVAKKVYLKHGFEGYELDPALGKALFWEKPLST